MRFQIISTLALPYLALAALSTCGAQTSKPAPETETYLLRYKLKAGESLVSSVAHFAETRTKMSEHEETSSSRTITEKVWEVTAAESNDNMTFEYRINSVELVQTVGEGEEQSYNSLTDKTVPEIFKQVAGTLSKPLAKVTINARGQVVKREGELNAPQLGIGELTLALPEEPLAIGAQWSVPRECRVKLESGAHKAIKVRELYTLEKVSAGVATLRIETQPLTPMADPAVEAQLIQQLSRGEIKFDLDNGRMLSKRLEWSDAVVGFRGPETSLRYDAKYTEELLPVAKRTATRSTSNKQ